MKKTIADYPELVKEWHPTKNGDLKPCNIAHKSNRKFWWECEKGHQWEAVCYSRTGKNKTGCPCCVGKKACPDNCLAITHPELVKEWHLTKNGNLTPNNITSGSDKNIWWMCDKGHEWKTKCNYKYGCPYCTNKKVCPDNCLATLFPEIAKEFHSTKNGNTTPNNIFAGTPKKYWWICEKNHEYQASCKNRTCKSKHGCPYCTNNKVCPDNCLATTHPELAKEWHPTKNSNLTPNDVITGSNKKYWWICSKGHEWKTSCDSRTGKRKSGCPICSESKGEKEVARILDKLNIPYKREFRFDNCKNIRILPFDFVLKINNTAKAIEYHGVQHYEPCNWGSIRRCKHENLKGIQKRDKKKREWCKSQFIPLLEICYKDYDKIEELITKFIDD